MEVTPRLDGKKTTTNNKDVVMICSLYDFPHQISKRIDLKSPTADKRGPK